MFFLHMLEILPADLVAICVSVGACTLFQRVTKIDYQPQKLPVSMCIKI